METLATKKVSIVLAPISESRIMKERIQQKANDLFCRYGVKSITMDEIAAQLGVSKKTIYQYYADKNELVDAVAKDLIGFSQSCCEKYKTEAGDAVHEIFEIMEFVQQMFGNMNPVMLFDLERFHPATYKAFLEYKNNYLLRMIKENLDKGIKEGYYRPEINIDVMARLRLEGMMAAFNTEIFPPAKYNLGELQQQIVEHFLFGIASLKGYQLILKYQQERLKSKAK
jgi:TetR/AcrR family transcriptional regulator, cholesterol catabolism regulator